LTSAVDKDVLRINVEKSEEKKEDKEEGGRKYHRYERSSQVGEQPCSLRLSCPVRLVLPPSTCLPSTVPD
jgi:hypothetical protein